MAFYKIRCMYNVILDLLIKEEWLIDIEYYDYHDGILVTFSIRIIRSHVLSKYRNTILLKSFKGYIYAYNWLFEFWQNIKNFLSSTFFVSITVFICHYYG